jgi:vitamin B12 transporter
VVVTATKSNTSTLELANSITIIDSADISNRNKINVFELLKTEYGVSYTTQGPQGTLANISIRGGDVGNTVVMIDGIKMNLTSDPANVYDFASLTVESIDRIEILRGPQSMLYGSDALSGVVNIISKKGNGKPLVSLLVEGGSYNTFKGVLGVSGSSNAFNYNLSFGRTQSEGFSAASEKYGNTEKDGYEGNNFISRFGFDFNDDTFLDLFVRFTKSNADYDQSGGEFGDDPTYKYNQEEFVTRAETESISMIRPCTIPLPPEACMMEKDSSWIGSTLSIYPGIILSHSGLMLNLINQLRSFIYFHHSVLLKV